MGQELERIKKMEQPYLDLGVEIGSNNGPHPVHGGDSFSCKYGEDAIVWKYHGSKNYRFNRGTIVDLYMIYHGIGKKDAIVKLLEKYGNKDMGSITQQEFKATKNKNTTLLSPIDVSGVSPPSAYEDSQGKTRQKIYRRNKDSLVIKDHDRFNITGGRSGEDVVLFGVMRWNLEGGKEVRPFCKINDDTWKLGFKYASEYLRPLYNSLQIKEQDNAEVWIVEGEKCMDRTQNACDRASRRYTNSFPDVIVTTSIGGSSAVGKCDWRVIEQENVYVIPDNDNGGDKYAKAIKNKLPNAKIVDLPVAKGEDIYDWLEDGGDVRDITKDKYTKQTEDISNERLPELDSHSSIAEYMIKRFYSTKEKTDYKTFVEYDLLKGDVQDFEDMDFKNKIRISKPVFDYGKSFYYDEREGLWAKLPEERVAYDGMKNMDGMYVRGNEEPKKFKANYTKMKNVFKFIQSMSKIEHDEFFTNSPIESIATTNETIAFDGRKLFRVSGPRTPIMLRARHRLPIDSDPNADKEPFNNFLRSCFMEGVYIDEDLSLIIEEEPSADEVQDCNKRIQLLQKYVGASLFGGVTKISAAVMLVGPGGGGKSIFMDVIDSLFPKEAVSAIAPQDMGGTHSLGPLVDAKVNMQSDVDKSDLLKSGTLKQIISGDSVEINEKYEKKFRATPKAGHLFSCNELPYVSDTSTGFWDRWLLVSFPKELRDTEHEIKGLDEKLKTPEVLGGVLEWAIEGFIECVRSDYTLDEPESSRGLIDGWRYGTDTVIQFVDQFLIEDGDIKKSEWPGAYEIYPHYSKFCDEINRNPLSRDRFCKRMTKISKDRFYDLNKSYVKGKKRYNIRIPEVSSI